MSLASLLRIFVAQLPLVHVENVLSASTEIGFIDSTALNMRVIFGLFILRVVELKIPINTICYIGSINTILKFNNSFFFLIFLVLDLVLLGDVGL